MSLPGLSGIGFHIFRLPAYGTGYWISTIIALLLLFFSILAFWLDFAKRVSEHLNIFAVSFLFSCFAWSIYAAQDGLIIESGGGILAYRGAQIITSGILLVVAATGVGARSKYDSIITVFISALAASIASAFWSQSL